MVKKSKSKIANKSSLPKHSLNWLSIFWVKVWSGGHIRKIFTFLAALLILFCSVSYAFAEYYIHKHDNEPMVLGTTFIPDYAQTFGLDSQQTLNAILGDLQIKQVRLVSYWSEVEPTPGHYDFSTLDWEFAMANKYDAKISLAIGLRQPRWPECHPPDWIQIDSKNKAAWEPQLYQYM